MQPILIARNLRKTYLLGKVEVHALRGVDMEVLPGEFIAIMGPSGSGKSTLLNLIGGLDKPTSGELIIEGRNIAKMSDRELTNLRRKRLGYIFQFYNLLPMLNVYQNVELPLIMNKVPRGERKRRVLQMLKLVNLEHRINAKIETLSGGEQQRVAIARALVINPAIVLADEPTGDLDSTTGEKIMALLAELNRKLRTTIIMVTHNPRDASYAQRIFHLRDGRIERIEVVRGK